MLYFKNKDCKLYNQDNLELLKTLHNNYIDLIYCDILYNTGRKFKDYDDNLGTPQEAILWYEPRLIEMKRVLKDTGSIYLHMDFRLVHYMKVKMDEIFEIKNFKNEIIWCYRGGGVSKRSFASKHDTVLVYEKKFKQSKFNIQYSEYSENSKKLIHQRDGTRIDGSKVDLERGCHMNDWWTDINSLQTWSPERIKYDTQKPKELLKRIILSSSNTGDIVADFFMGSGTTGEVAVELGRKFIGCDISERACEITKNRILSLNGENF